MIIATNEGSRHKNRHKSTKVFLCLCRSIALSGIKIQNPRGFVFLCRYTCSSA
jgi:hypothetical protein